MCASVVTRSTKNPNTLQDELNSKNSKDNPKESKTDSKELTVRKLSPSGPGTKPPLPSSPSLTGGISKVPPTTVSMSDLKTTTRLSTRTETTKPSTSDNGGKDGSTSSDMQTLKVSDALTVDNVQDLKTVSLASTGQPQNTKGYDNAADVITNLLNSDLMGEVHQYLATKMSGMDLSFATFDVVVNPDRYTAEQKTLTYMDLIYTHARYETFKGDADKWRDGINNSGEIDEDFKNAIAILGSDKDVQSGYVKYVLDAFKMRFNWQQLTPYENDDPLDQINQRDKKDAAMKPTLQAVVASFDRDIVEGGLLKKGLEAGKPPTEILQEYQQTLGVYLSILPEEKWFDIYRNPEDPGLLTGPSFQERMTKAEDNYKEFFATHILPNAPDPGSVFQDVIKQGKENALGGQPRNTIPGIDFSNLKLDGPVFGNLSVDVTGLRSIANSDFYRKDGDGLKNLFRPTVEVMSKLRYPDGATSPDRVQRKIDVEAHRKAFTDAVLSQVDPLMDQLAKGPMTQQQLTAYLDGISFTPSTATPYLFKSDVIAALRGLAMGSHALSKIPPDPTAKAGATGGNISGYSFNNISAGLTVATGLAGKSLQAYGIEGLGNQERFSLEKVFGGDVTGAAWSEAAFTAKPQNMETAFWDNSLTTMGKTVAVSLRETPNVTGTVTDPRSFTREDEKNAIYQIVGPSAQALAASYFKDDAKAAETFTSNMSTILAAVWGLAKPGGDIHTLKVNITAAVESGIKTAPPNIELSRYKTMVVNGVTTIVNALRTSWVAGHNPNATWDMIGLGTMHALCGLSALLKGGSAFANKLIPHMESMLPGEPDFINQRRISLAKALGTAGKVVGNLAGVGYAPIEIFQLAKALKSGGDPVDLALMGIGTLADTGIAVGSLAGLGEGLINSAWASRGAGLAAGAGRSLAGSAPFRFFAGIVSSTVFTTLSAVSWIAWGGHAIWQLIKSENKYNKIKDALDDDMKRLINTNMSFYVIKSRDTDRNGVPYKDDDAPRVLTKEDWGWIRWHNEQLRQSQGWDDWKIPDPTKT